MQPNHPSQPSQPHPPAGPGPQPPYHQQEYTIDSNVQSSRHTFGASQDFQQHPSGAYEVVPPIPANPNAISPGHNPYEFIMAPNTKPKRTMLNLNTSSLLARVGLIVGGLTVLVIIAAILFSVLAPKGATPGLTQTAERQQEIVRIATAASLKVSGQEATNFVTNVKVSVTSEQQQTLDYLSSRGVKVDKKTLALDQDSSTDTLLTNALSAGNYDTVATQTLASQLQTYATLLKNTYKQAGGPKAKQLIQSSYDSTTNLLKQYQALSVQQQG